jgi:transketolase
MGGFKIMVDSTKVRELKGVAGRMRCEIIKMMGSGKPHHFGGSLSEVEIITGLYFYKMRYHPSDPSWPDRDRFVMSKGHSVPAQYVALAILGVFPYEYLSELKTLGACLQGHPCMKTPGIEACTGSLGQGLSYSNGIALAARLANRSFRVYTVLGDGELQEGQVWEAALTSSARKLDNLTAIIDRNRLASQGGTEDAKPLEPLKSKWESFGWHALEIDGHDVAQVCDALDTASNTRGKPTVIIANTIKGKGVSFIEGDYRFHNAPLSKEQYAQAVKELEAALEGEE